MSYSQQFKDFILDLQQWIENDFKSKDHFFEITDSVCFQIKNWNRSEADQQTVKMELAKALKGEHVPFNPKGQTFDYDCEAEEDTYNHETFEIGHYRNPLRLAWIKNLADEFKKEIKSC